ncbi:oxygen-insensitive NADPH nitroreductase [Bacillus sp. HMF5848]|uniref:oxygen-insensitive NADPH nitroreductase n=1 Tax=Bacillus sp. HMF5848 TaxID=2495421 RepID=UPI000F7A3B49|nr:oxygen-insensitive NADPH nitroreductase [Bacillus sp. HMF5848]RSK26416.1 oxygen-insensitive NADPH nitroreductase [Bacillus sp. HMF5848]
MNDTIQTILSHVSVRKFEDKLLSQEQIQTIVKAAQAASTSSFVQAYTIVGVTDRIKKEKLAEIAGGQSYVADNGHFFVFCADLHRHELAADIEGGANISETLESTEKFMVATIDAALAAQNASVAAESMGLGICYIGGIRNNLPEVVKLLDTPNKVVPLFGLAVGYPAEKQATKPRLQFEHIYHENTYQDDSASKTQLHAYNKTISAYYHDRTNGRRADSWTEQIAKMMSKPVRMYMKDFLNKIGIPLK